MNTTSDNSGFSATKYLGLLFAFFLGILTVATIKGCPF